jgi:hypothetical protein
MVKKCLSFLLLLMTPVVFMAQEVDLKRGLVAFYTFDTGSNDISGNGNDGVVTNAELVREAHMGSGSYKFKGLDERGEIRVHNSNSLQFNTAASFSFWFNRDSQYGHEKYNNMLRSSPTGEQEFFLKNNKLRGRIQALDAKGNSNKIYCSLGGENMSATINRNINNSWHHVVFVFHKEHMKIYLDGSLLGSKDCNLNFSYANNSDFREGDLFIGGTIGVACPFHGYIDEFRIYNRELNEAEVSALFKGEGELYSVLHYRDYKFSDNEPDYKLLEDNIKLEGISYCESNKKLYILDGATNNTVVEYDLTNIMDKDVKRRTISLPFKAEIINNTMAISPNGQYLALVDEEVNALHIIEVVSGKEIASAKLGKKFVNVRSDNGKNVGHPFQFQSNNEILVSGAAAALWFDIAQNKGKTISFDKQSQEYVKTHVTSTGRVAGYKSGRDFLTFEISQGKINKISPVYYYENYNKNYSIMNKDRVEDCYKKTGEIIPEDYFNSDMSKYVFKFTRTIRKYYGLTTITDSKVYLTFSDHITLNYWLDNGKLLLISDKHKETIQIFNHTLTDNEMIKQQLLAVIDSKNIVLFNEFLNDNPNSPYTNVAQQKRLECIRDNWNTISNPTNYSVSHYNEVKGYIDKYGSEVNVDAAKAELNSIYKRAYESIGNSDIAGLENYISYFPKSPYLSQVQQKLKNAYKAEYDDLCRRNDLQSYLDYAKQHPNSPYISDINNRARMIQHKQEAEEQRIKAEEERRQQEELQRKNTAKLNSVGKTIYWIESVSFDISSGDEGWLQTIVSDKLGTNRVTYNVKYTAIVEATLGNSAVKCVISNVQIIEEKGVNWHSTNYVKYKSSAMSTLSNDIGKTRVKQLNEFELQ